MSTLKTLPIAGLLIATILNIFYNVLLRDSQIPEVAEQNWGSKKNRDDIRQFSINISDLILADLKNNLVNSKLPKQLPSLGNEYGIGLDSIKEFTKYWLENYNWKEREKYLNKYPQFLTTIKGLDIHFVHIKSEPTIEKKKIPVLIMHGWPGTFSEFYKMIPKIIENEEKIAFDIVIPSMPGFFFSDPPEKLGFRIYDCADMLLKLMQRLGYEKFYLYGTDWGSAVVMTTAVMYPDNVLGVNTPLCISTKGIYPVKHFLEYFVPDWIRSRDGKNFIEQSTFVLKNAGYFYFQATYPDVIGMSFAQSPIGFMAHILNMVIQGHNTTYTYSKETGLHVFEKDVLLDQVMLFWLTDSIGSSMRIYSYFLEFLFDFKFTTNVPFSCPLIKNEIFEFSDWILSDSFKNVVQRTEFNNTGHFYPLEKDLQIQTAFAKDFVNFVDNTKK